MAKFRPNLGQFWPKWVIFEFAQKSQNVKFVRLQRQSRLGVNPITVSRILVEDINKKDTSILGFIAQKIQFKSFKLDID